MSQHVSVKIVVDSGNSFLDLVVVPVSFQKKISF